MSPMTLPLTDDFLDAKRRVGDETADRVVAALIEAHKIDEVDRDLLAVLRNNDSLPEDLPASVKDYFEQTEGPLQVDEDSLRRAQKVFATYGPEILMVLGFYALPAAYAARKGVQVLHRTAFLAERPVRRVFETSRMVAEVMAPGGLEAGGEGLRIIEKVRLMHAGIRMMLQQDEEHPWDPDLGVPINQEDMAGTLMTFSYIVVSGLEQLHIELDPADADAYIQTWFAIGRRMGVHEDLIPANMQEAEELTRRIRERQIAGSPEGVDLTKALLDGYSRFQHLPKSAPASMVHFFLDDDALMHQNVARMLEVPPARWFGIVPRLLIDFIRAFRFLMRRGPVQAGVLRWLSRHLVAGLLELDENAAGATFSIPDRLHDDWKLPVKGARV